LIHGCPFNLKTCVPTKNVAEPQTYSGFPVSEGDSFRTMPFPSPFRTCSFYITIYSPLVDFPKGRWKITSTAREESGEYLL